MIKKTFSKECQEELQEKIKVIYPWSLKNHNIISLNYDGLIQDLTIYWNEEAQHREGFTYSDTEVTIPNFFTVLNGVYQDSYKQKKLESSLKNSRNTLYFDTVKAFELTIGMDLESLDENSEAFYTLIRTFPSTQNPDVMDLRNRLKVEDKENYMFLTLSPFIRKQFIEKIKVIKENYQKEFKSFEYLNNAMFLTDKYVELLNNFDYPFDVPKIVIKENVGDSFSEEGIEFLTLMNLLGVDIVILNPYGHNDINNRIELNEIILGNKKNEKRALLKDNVITSVLSTVIVFGLIFSSIFGMVSCYKIFISPYDKKEGELQESINLFKYEDYEYAIGEKGYINESNGDLLLYLGNPASNKNNVYYKLYYGETKILDDGLAPFTYATLECTNCKLKEGTYKFKLEIIFENGKLFTSNSKTSQEISLEIVSKEKFKELRKALAH